MKWQITNLLGNLVITIFFNQNETNSQINWIKSAPQPHHLEFVKPGLRSIGISAVPSLCNLAMPLTEKKLAKICFALCKVFWDEKIQMLLDI